MRMRTLGWLVMMLAVPAAGQDGDKSAGAKALCAKYADVALPGESRLADVPAVYPACESYKSYAGIGRRVDYVAARSCAWRERAAQKEGLARKTQSGTGWVVGGDAILVDLYANGLGVPKDVGLAVHLACEQGSGIAADSIDALEKLDGEGQLEKQVKRFDSCDWAMTTFAENFCSDYQNEIADAKAEREFARLSLGWSDVQKRAFEKLKSAEGRYVSAHDAELDQGGTIHSIRDIASQAILKHNFLLEVRQFEKTGLPHGTAKDAARAERRMQEQFDANVAKASAPVEAVVEGTAVKAEAIIKVQAAWREYRDAWVDFAAVRYPKVAGAAFRAYFADARYELLKVMNLQIYR